MILSALYADGTEDGPEGERDRMKAIRQDLERGRRGRDAAEPKTKEVPGR